MNDSSHRGLPVLYIARDEPIEILANQRTKMIF